MPSCRVLLVALVVAGCTARPASKPLPDRPVVSAANGSATTSATTRPAVRLIEFPGVVVDRSARQVRVDCEALGLVDTPLEFLCVMAGGPEHEAVLRTQAKPSHIHAGLLLLGLDPGSPVLYDEKLNTWTPPHGPGVQAIAEWTAADGAVRRLPAEQLIRSIKNGTPMPPTAFLFAGSHVRPIDGVYLADLTGYVLSICNFEHTLLDVPGLVSSANETLEWETDLTHGPARGTPVTLILEPVDDAATSHPAHAEDPEISALRRRRQALLDEAGRVDGQIREMDANSPRAATRAFEP